MIYYMFVLTPRKDQQKPNDDVLIYIRDSEPFIRGWQDGLVGRLLKKQDNYRYQHPYKVFGRVEVGEILIIIDWEWRQIR